MKDFFHSTVFKIAALMFSISFLAVLSMFSSMFISDSAQTDAYAVNVAGSLRMQSFKIVSHLQNEEIRLNNETEVTDLIKRFERDLTTGILASQLASAKTEELEELHQEAKNEWFEHIKPMYLLALREPTENKLLIEETLAFVDGIDRLVSGYQKVAEGNISMIRLIQSLALFCTLLLIAFAMFIVHRHIEQPLSKLTSVARQIGRGDFTVTADENGKGELAILASAMNRMSRSIYRSQSQLEQRVKRKTEALQHSNASLELLYKISRNLNEMDPENYNFDYILKQLSSVSGVKDMDLCIMTAAGEAPYEHLISSDKVIPQKCLERDCGDCMDHKNSSPLQSKQLKYSLIQGDTNFGVLVVNSEDDATLDDWQHQLFESIAEQIALGLSMKHQNEQGRRIALMNERTVIARELHDSLAQALSYLKIQVSRLQKLQQKDNAQEQIDEVIHELKNGLSSAYRELRELLTTFRLKLDEQNLKKAFEQTIEQLESRSDSFTFSLEFSVSHVPFSPQEEIHVLQIAREAMQNAFYHSQGNHIEVGFSINDESMVTLSIADNGIGMPNDPNKLNHYGLAIMQERSRNLNGDLVIERSESGGTRVLFKFRPVYSQDEMAVKQTA